MTNTRTYPIPWLLLLALLLAAFALRLHRLDAVPLRGDEAYGVLHWSAPPFTERWQTLIRDEPAPFGAFTLYWAWKGLAGETVFATRYLSLLGNLLGLAVIITLARRLLRDPRLALLAGILWAVHPYLIWHAQDARTYGILSALTPLSFYLLHKSLQKSPKSRGRAWPNVTIAGRTLQIRPPERAWWPYIAIQTAALYVYYLEPFWMVAQLLFVLIVYHDRLWALIRAWVVIGVLWIPVGAQLYTLMFVSQYEGNAESAQASLLLTQFVPTLLFGENTWPVGMGALVVALLGMGLAVLGRTRRGLAVLLAAWIFVPPLLLYGASFFSDFFRPRYVTTVIPALILALVAVPYYVAKTFFHADGMYAVPTMGMQSSRGVAAYGLTLAGCMLFVAVSVAEVTDYFYNDPPKGADWPGMVSYLDARLTPHDAIITGAIDPAIEYYYRGEAELVFVPQDDPAPETYLPERLGDVDGIYVLAGARTGDVGQYLQAQMQAIPGDKWPGVTQFRPWEVNPREIAVPLDLQLGEVAILRGYTLLDDDTLLLYWEGLATTEADHRVLLHIQAAPDAPPVATLDHGVAGAIISTRAWVPGTVYRDPVALPDLPPGTYELLVGMYPTMMGELLLAAGVDDDDGRYAVGTLRVE